MIPRLPFQNEMSAQVSSFLKALKKNAFQGTVHSNFGDRLASSTDNSIYQIIPQGVLFPKNQSDILVLTQLLNSPPYQKIKVSPRGGGTGTNGQSLTDGIVIDLSRYMNQILEINVEEGWARVEPGVVLDQLNEKIKPDGVFFPPTASTSNRATLGGMVNTDACGKGSFIYGRTSDHILELTTVLANGEVITTREKTFSELKELRKKTSPEGKITHSIASICEIHRDQIATTLPQTRRCLTGYNLEKIINFKDQTFNLNYLLAGSEGTLGIITEIKVRLTPIPKYKQLVVVKYQSFNDALKDSSDLLKCSPFAIETTGSNVIEMAKEDEIYSQIKECLSDEGGIKTATINLVEFCSYDAGEAEKKAKNLIQSIQQRKGKEGQPTGFYLANTPEKMAAIWEFRKKGVGLLGKLKGQRRPIPFVEDTVVPPQNLAPYIRDFIQILDRYALSYGMFGHIDVGCLHVRPALNMKDPADEVILQKITAEVVDLVHRYGGVFWGEHGKGFRSSYLPTFFGEILYTELRRIKATFDPENRLNPGKIAVPLGLNEDLSPLESPTRGQRDRDIAPAYLEMFDTAISCNGNGACLSFNPNEVICPSSKILKDKVNSPKGRIDLLREWLRQLSEQGASVSFQQKGGILNWPMRLYQTLLLKWGRYDFSRQVFDALSGCLACKACASQCPLKVDVAEFRPKFFNAYYSRFQRPIRDYLVSGLEKGIIWQSKIAKILNYGLKLKLTALALKYGIGVVDIPSLSEYTLAKGLKDRGDHFWDFQSLKKRKSDVERDREVIVVQDAFTSFYEARLVLNIYDLLTRLGFRVYIHRFFESGKGTHIKGFLPKFKSIAEKNFQILSKLSKLGINLIGIDPAITLSYSDEHLKALGKTESPYKVELIQKWLLKHADRLHSEFHDLIQKQKANCSADFHLFGHCSEKTTAIESTQQWQDLFKLFGLSLKPIAVGCCGMGGVFGHERNHFPESQQIFNLSWKPKIEEAKAAGAQILVPGYSCRCQVKRFEAEQLKHPLEAILDSLKLIQPEDNNE